MWKFQWLHLGTVEIIWIIIVLITIGTVLLGIANGWSSLTDKIVDLVKEPNNNKLVTIPGWIGDWGGKQETINTLGSHWTVIMIFSFLIALMGNQASPAMSMWVFSNKEPRYFAHQVLASAVVIGVILILFPVIQGFGGHLLHADTVCSGEHSSTSTKNFIEMLPYNNQDGKSQEGDRRCKNGSDKKEFDAETLVPLLIRSTYYISEKMSGWLMALLAICALAAIQSTAASYMVTFGSILSHDFIKPFSKELFKSNLSELDQIRWARVGVILVTLIALNIATSVTSTMAYLGALAVAFGLQMVPALVGLCWWPFLSRAGIVVGLITGIIVVIFTEVLVKHWFGFELIKQWPLTIHSAVWGLGINFILVVTISFFHRNEPEKQHRQKFHQILNQHASLDDKGWKKHLVWLLPLSWGMLAMGPGIMIPQKLLNSEIFEVPSIWIWQIIGWISGVAMILFLAYKMGLSTEPKGEVVENINGDDSLPTR